ncbi:MAG: hypothetical protein M3124_00825 [Actinomycetota bacterium]|nr:hypothetical protein [Actinomycetota bacterium]
MAVTKLCTTLLAIVLMLGATACGSTEDPPEVGTGAGATSTLSPTPSPVEDTPPPAESTSPQQSPDPDEGEGEYAYEEGEGTENDNSSELFPDPVVPEQGRLYFGVYFVVTENGAGDSKIRAAESDLRNLGFEPSVGGIDCDSGAKEALGLDPSRSYTDVALYFASRADADMFVTLYDPGVVGTAKVKAFCLD